MKILHLHLDDKGIFTPIVSSLTFQQTHIDKFETVKTKSMYFISVVVIYGKFKDHMDKSIHPRHSGKGLNYSCGWVEHTGLDPLLSILCGQQIVDQSEDGREFTAGKILFVWLIWSNSPNTPFFSLKSGAKIKYSRFHSKILRAGKGSMRVKMEDLLVLTSWLLFVDVE